jgi:hypothetical protein
MSDELVWNYVHTVVQIARQFPERSEVQIADDVLAQLHMTVVELEARDD